MNSTKINLKNLEINPLLAEICGIHAGDGYLRNDGKRREWDISGNIEEKKYYDQHVIPLFKKVFSIKIKGKLFPHRNTYGFVIRDKKIVEFVHENLGFPYGKKSLKVKIPASILENLSLKKSFLRGYFDTDGHLGFGKKYGLYSEFKKTRHCYPRIMFTTVSENIVKSLKEIFEELNFNFVYYTYQPKEQTESLKYRIDINGPKNLKRWLCSIGINNPTKYSRFLIWKKYGFCPTNINYPQRLKILKGLLDPNLCYKGL